MAARLAEAGFQVLLLEAGGDPRTSIGDTPQTPGVNSLPDDYDVPAFHALSTENNGIRWDFFVRHYADEARQERDPKYRETVDGKAVDGVLYPRAATLGGCTAHNAMILVYPHNADWNQIADLTGDPSWRAEHMRAYFERIERCAHRPDERALQRLGHESRAATAGRAGCRPKRRFRRARPSRPRPARRRSSSRHARSCSSPELAITDADRRAQARQPARPERLARRLGGRDRPPLHAADDRAITGASARASASSTWPGSIPDRLKVELNALATRVLFDEQRPRHRRRVPERRAPLRRPPAAERERLASAAGVRGARSDPAPAARSTRRSC